MIRSVLAALLLSCAGAVGAAPDDIVLPKIPVAPTPPPPPVPASVSSLSGDSLYVVQSKTPLIVRPHPLGLVKVTAEAGPLTVRGRFVDGTGGVETRKFSSPNVYILEAAGSGRVEIDLIPVGVKAEADIVAVALDVDAGQGPRPPPKPDPDPKPTPVAAAWVIVVEQTEQRTPAVAAVLSDVAMWKRIEAKGVKWRVYDADSPDAKAKRYDAVAAPIGLPCVILLDATGAVVGAYKLPTKSADLEGLVK